jgi:hypothetical protein
MALEMNWDTDSPVLKDASLAAFSRAVGTVMLTLVRVLPVAGRPLSLLAPPFLVAACFGMALLKAMKRRRAIKIMGL